jgi:hypothetical protein
VGLAAAGFAQLGGVAGVGSAPVDGGRDQSTGGTEARPGVAGGTAGRAAGICWVPPVQ